MPQPADGVTYAAKITKEECRIDWRRSAAELDRQIRGLSPAPGAFFEIDGERLTVLAADLAPGSGAPGTILDDRLTIACGEGALRPTLVKRAGKRAMSAEEMLRGFCRAEGHGAVVTRFKFTLEYDGGAFVGWQRQENGMSVQQALEEAVFKTCAETVTAHAAGRTDAGVHAPGRWRMSTSRRSSRPTRCRPRSTSI